MPKYLIAFAMLALTGCAPLPVPDNNKTAAEQATVSLPFGEIRTFEDVHQKFKAYYLLYSTEAAAKREDLQRLSEGTFYGSVISVLGGIGKSKELLPGGALLASGAGLISDRYNLKVQASNYELAANAMLCMYRAGQKLELHKESLGFYLFHNKTSADNALREQALDAFLEVRSRLIKLQSDVALGTPDVERLKKAINQPGDPSTVSVQSTFANPPLTSEELAAYKSSLDECVAKISG